MTLNTNCFVKILDDDCLILIQTNIRKKVEQIYTGNQSATMIIKGLMEKKTKYEIISSIQKAYEIDYRIAEKDYHEFLHFLTLKNIFIKD